MRVLAASRIALNRRLPRSLAGGKALPARSARPGGGRAIIDAQRLGIMVA
jgi:hypothetical protein